MGKHESCHELTWAPSPSRTSGQVQSPLRGEPKSQSNVQSCRLQQKQQGASDKLRGIACGERPKSGVILTLVEMRRFVPTEPGTRAGRLGVNRHGGTRATSSRTILSSHNRQKGSKQTQTRCRANHCCYSANGVSKKVRGAPLGNRQRCNLNKKIKKGSQSRWSCAGCQ